MKNDEIRFVSAIDTKPVQPPYLKLLSLKQFRKKIHDEKQSQNSGQQVAMSSQESKTKRRGNQSNQQQKN